MKPADHLATTLSVLAFVFLALAAAFCFDLWGHVPPTRMLPLVDRDFIEPATVRESYSVLVKNKADLSDFDCYGCHEKGKPPPIRYDTNHVIIIPKEHANLVMAHGRHNRNNNCFNCHDEQNLERFQTRDGQALTFGESTPLCGSCHGPTYRDWEAGVHGRTSGHWFRSVGQHQRRDCVECHNPHNPKFPGRKPAPGPNPLREQPHQARAH